MAQQVKELKVRLNGEVGKGVSSISNSLSQMGALLDQIGGKSREFQKESLEIYRGYEDNMLAAKFALSSQYTSATQLSRVMDTLHDSAQTWAASTIFHTDDVSQAINEAAHAGWSLEEIMEGVPDAMKIAQAGGLDLSTGLDYLIKMANSTGTEFGDMGTLIDQWAMAANSSATNIQELGEAFMSMGSAAQFGDSTAELFTLLGVLADVGTTGSQAGTALRSAMVRLIAPTTKAENAMDLLGADAEELEEVLSNTNVTKAVKMLEGLGWSAYENGKLKSIKDIFSELFQVTESLDEASRNEIISAIFPTRTIATALALMTASGDKIDDLYAKISNSEGYAEKGSQIMMSGLTGSVETLQSKWEEFQRSVGENFSPTVESFSDLLGKGADFLNSMDEPALSALNGVLTSLSIGGPLLLGAGAVTKFFAAVGPVGGSILFAALGTSALIGALTKLSDEQFNSHFGGLKVEAEELVTEIDSVKTRFQEETGDMDAWLAKLEESRSTYESTLTYFEEHLLKETITGNGFTDEEYNELVNLGKDVGKAVQDGVKQAKDTNLTFLTALFGDMETDEEARAALEGVLVTEQYWDGMYDEAFQIGENIRAELTAALQNGELTPEDRQAIQAQVRRYNEIMRQIAEAKSESQWEAQLYSASRVSWDTLDSFLSTSGERLKEQREQTNSRFESLYGDTKTAWKYAMENGQDTFEVNGVTYTLQQAERFEDTDLAKEIHRENDDALRELDEKYSDAALRAVDATVGDSYQDAWDFMRGLTRDENGNYNIGDALAGMTAEELNDLSYRLMELSNSGIAGRLPEEAKEFGIYDYIRNLLDLTYAAADKAQAEKARLEGGLYGDLGYVPSQAEMGTALEIGETQGTLETLRARQEQLDAEISQAEERLSGQNRPWNYFLTGGESKDKVALYGANVFGEYQGGGLYDQKQEVDLDIAEAESKLAQLQQQIDGLTQTQTVTVNVKTRIPKALQGVIETPLLYAEGGRATEASVFGEAGPEWAIPEKHDGRTAELLNAAREASGFTWGDLISRNGGLNSRPGGNSVVVHYSPVINAGDANGVESVLSADKGRLIRIMKDAMDEMKYRDSMEVFA